MSNIIIIANKSITPPMFSLYHCTAPTAYQVSQPINKILLLVVIIDIKYLHVIELQTL